MGISLKGILSWFANIFKHIKDDGAKVAITVTQGVKQFLDSGVADGLAKAIDGMVGTHLAEDAVTLLKDNVNKALAAELALQGLPDDPTGADVQAFEDSVIKAFTGLDAAGKSKLYTTLAAQVYGIIERDLNGKDNIPFAQLVADIEEAYQDYLKDVDNENSGGVTA